MGNPTMPDDTDDATGRDDRLAELISASTSRWRRFVRELDEEALQDTLVRLEKAVHQAEQVHRDLDARESDAGDGGEPGGDDPRSPVGEPLLTQVRSLDKLVWRINADWMQMQRRATLERASALRDRLREALSQTEEIGRTVRSQPELLEQAEVLPIDTRSRSSAADDETPYRDPDTGLFTEAGFVKLLQAEITRSERYGRPVSLLALSYPADTGQSVTEVAETIGVTIRDSDFVGRSESGELLLGLPDTKPEDAGAAASRIASRLASQDLWDEETRAAVVAGPDESRDAAGLLDEVRGRLESQRERLAVSPMQ